MSNFSPMIQIVTSRHAQADLDNLAGLLAHQSLGAADCFVELLDHRCRALSGSSPGSRSTLQTFGFGRYTVHYRPTAEGILITRILPHPVR